MKFNNCGNFFFGGVFGVLYCGQMSEEVRQGFCIRRVFIESRQINVGIKNE